MGAHARFSPSSGKRYLSCPPSLRLEEQFADEQSPYAAEGTAGHEMAEYLIKKHLKKRTKRPVSDYYTDELMEAVMIMSLTASARLRKQSGNALIRISAWS